MDRYLIYSSQPGTIDVVAIGVVCGDLPEGLKQVGKEVVFSGIYKNYTPASMPPVGHTWYYLELSKAELKGGN
ncbi:hypothetical protein GCM10011375_40860 [Hymenobacter qilianensis]|nr:hypothetical protein GCM10011375_40860 [Hymenobacter qilianensis]